MRFPRLIVIGACALLTAASPTLAAKRVALVIGNNAYENVPKLMKAVNDANAVSTELAKLGFEVVTADDVGRRAMSRALVELEGKVAPGDTALIYFAGHGFAIDGNNYLLPVDVPIAGPGEEGLVIDAAFAASRLADRLQEKGAATVILILDACRDNPFALTGKRSLGNERGLARMDPAEGMFVLFSAGQGQSALDRLCGTTIRNTVFTRTLLAEMAMPGELMVQIAKKTQAKVRELAAKVSHVQVPAYYDQIVGDLYLSPRARAAAGGNVAKLEEGAGESVLPPQGSAGRGSAGNDRAARELHPLQQRLDGQRVAARAGDAVRLPHRRRGRLHRPRLHRRARPAHRRAHAEDLVRDAPRPGQDHDLRDLARQTRRAGRRLPHQFRSDRCARRRAEVAARAIWTAGLGFATSTALVYFTQLSTYRCAMIEGATALTTPTPTSCSSSHPAICRPDSVPENATIYFKVPPRPPRCRSSSPMSTARSRRRAASTRRNRGASARLLRSVSPRCSRRRPLLLPKASACR